MHHVSFTGSKATQNFLLIFVVLNSLNLIAASNLKSALSESNIRLSDEGYLVYGSLPDITKAHLFRDYVGEFDREVTANPLPLLIIIVFL
jgi:hypothetical protein